MEKPIEELLSEIQKHLAHVESRLNEQGTSHVKNTQRLEDMYTLVSDRMATQDTRVAAVRELSK